MHVSTHVRTRINVLCLSQPVEVDKVLLLLSDYTKAKDGGSTFNAEQSHGSLTVGKSVVNGYRLTKRTITSQGDDCFVFAPAKEGAHV